MMVVGPVGAGKSSLLAALLGEMRADKTAVTVAGDELYCLRFTPVIIHTAWTDSR